MADGIGQQTIRHPPDEQPRGRFDISGRLGPLLDVGRQSGKTLVKKLILIGIALAVAYVGGVESGLIPGRQHDAAIGANGADAVLSAAFENRRSDVQVQGSGHVTRVLPDDNDGSRHQRFIVRLASGQTLLVAHNIDLANRVAAVKPGDVSSSTASTSGMNAVASSTGRIVILDAVTWMVGSSTTGVRINERQTAILVRRWS